MAEAMHITPDTVRSYVKNILAKLGVHSRLQVAAIASRGQTPAGGPAGSSPGQG
jgi:DNA-binding NarL/FixJ family response regulator